jgi:hypothetical protein
MPRIRSRLDRMEPRTEACTMRISFCGESQTTSLTFSMMIFEAVG